MSMFGALNRSVFKRTSTFLLAVAGGSFFFERTFDLVSVSIFESINKGLRQLNRLPDIPYICQRNHSKIDYEPWYGIQFPQPERHKLWKDVQHKFSQ